MNLLANITPINLKEEHDKFLKSNSYHPVFKYSWQDKKPKFKITDDKTALIAAVIGEDTATIVASAKKYFLFDNWEYLELAKSIIATKPNSYPKQEISDFVNEFNKAFAYLGLSEYKIEVVDQHGFNFRPSVKTKSLLMSKYANFQFFEAVGETKHELSHIIRFENSEYNGIPSSENYLATEEGLATLMDDKRHTNGPAQFQHAAEYIASYVGLNGSLRDVFDYFVSIGFNKELAWQRAARHKFGFINTKEPGDILKPTIYFANSQKIGELSNEEILRLYVGRISLADLNNHKEYKGKFPIEKLQSFFDLV